MNTSLVGRNALARAVLEDRAAVLLAAEAGA